MGALLKAVPFAEKELGTDRLGFNFKVIILKFENFSTIKSVTASYLVAAMGLAELIFRIPFGWAGDHPSVNRTYLLGGTFLMLGVFFGAFPMCKNFTMLMVFSSLSGIFQVITLLVRKGLKLEHRVVSEVSVSSSWMIF